MTTLSLPTSRKIFELIGEYETEKVWSIPNPGRAANGTERKALEESTIEVYSRKTKWGSKFDSIPTPTFAELIRVLPKIAEKKEWFGCQLETERLTRLYQNAPTEPDAMLQVNKYLDKLLT